MIKVQLKNHRISKVHLAIRKVKPTQGLVCTIQLGKDVLIPAGAWSGLEEDLGRGTIYA